MNDIEEDILKKEDKPKLIENFQDSWEFVKSYVNTKES